jgi:hypothetical protein
MRTCGITRSKKTNNYLVTENDRPKTKPNRMIHRDLDLKKKETNEIVKF